MRCDHLSVPSEVSWHIDIGFPGYNVRVVHHKVGHSVPVVEGESVVHPHTIFNEILRVIGIDGKYFVYLSADHTCRNFVHVGEVLGQLVP